MSENVVPDRLLRPSRIWYNVAMNENEERPFYDVRLREEEVKHRVAADWFASCACALASASSSPASDRQCVRCLLRFSGVFITH